MMNATFAISSLQSHFKKSFDTGEKEVELAILHVEQSVGKSEKAVAEIRDLRKKVSESFGNVKKLVMQFNSACLFFIGLNVDPLNTRLNEFLLSDDFGLTKQKARKERRERMEGADKLRRKLEKEQNQLVRKPLFDADDKISCSKAKRKKVETMACEIGGSEVKADEKKSGGGMLIELRSATDPIGEALCPKPASRKKAGKGKKGADKNQKYTEEEMRKIEAELSPSSEEDAKAPKNFLGLKKEETSEPDVKDQPTGLEEGEILDDQ